MKIKPYEEIHWFHQVPLGDGRITPGAVPVVEWAEAYLFNAIDFTGRSVLDIGCWDGYFSFEAEKRGATQVVALDSLAFRPGSTMDGFYFLRDHFKSKVEFREGSIFDLEKEDRFDVVLCFGLIYHVNDPLTVAINCFRAAYERVVFEGMIYNDEQACLRLAAPYELNPHDPSNIYLVSIGFLNKVANMCGFELDQARIASPEEDPLRARGSALYRRVLDRTPGYPRHCFSKPPTAAG